MLEVECCNQTEAEVDSQRLIDAVHGVLQDAGIQRGAISVAVVDDPTIHRLNREHLDHDYATDVLSFVFDASDEHVEGEVIVSVDTAAAQAEQYGWSSADELLLYVIHGTLHLVGYDDKCDDARQAMRAAEAQQLLKFHLTPPNGA